MDIVFVEEDVVNDFFYGSLMFFLIYMDENDKVLSKFIRDDDKFDLICFLFL